MVTDAGNPLRRSIPLGTPARVWETEAETDVQPAEATRPQRLRPPGALGCHDNQGTWLAHNKLDGEAELPAVCGGVAPSGVLSHPDA